MFDSLGKCKMDGARKILEIPWATEVPHVGQGTTGERADRMVGNLDLVTVFQTVQT